MLASTKMENIASAVAQVLDDVLKFKPLVEVIKTPSGKVVFREDRKYFVNTEEFNPFTADAAPAGDVSDERGQLIISSKNLHRAWGSLDFDYVGNPALLQIIADLLTQSLNEEQSWTKRHAAEESHFLQEYLDIEKLLARLAPEAIGEYHITRGNIETEKSAFLNNIMINRPGLTQEEAMKVYQARGIEYEHSLMRDFWALREVRIAVDLLTNSLSKIVMNLFPAVRAFAERSVSPAHGYDVFYAFVEVGDLLVVKNLGDYRILHWELQQ